MTNGKTEKILIVEDEKKISDIVAMYLEKEGFGIVVADTGQKAMRVLHEPFSLMIIDLMLPDISGEDLCKTIRQSSDVPIIILTAKSGEEDRIRGLGLGADDYVIKPFSPRELVARVKAHLRRTKKMGKKVLSFNDGLLVMDTENFEVRRDGVPTTLTSTEFRILLFLAERPGRVLSRLQLINMVQGYDFEGYDRTIDAHVKNLRHKIGDDQKKPVFIKTVYGVGYKFIGTQDAD